jgi:hypothetical protein
MSGVQDRSKQRTFDHLGNRYPEQRPQRREERRDSENPEAQAS